MIRVPPRLLLAAYAQGVFPMGEGDEILWFSPDPRAIIPLDRFHVPRTLRARVRRGDFEIRVDGCFTDVMRRCADRPEGTWITPPILEAYQELHRLGHAHSVEAWRDDRLAGGLYGVVLGGAFFGESMFHHEADASKVALVALVDRLRSRGFTLLDAQFMTAHLRRFGAIEIPAAEYLKRLDVAVRQEVRFL